MAGKKILIVDDEDFIRNLAERTLKLKGFEIFPAGNGSEALKQAKAVLPDLILLDYLMPEMDGFEVCKQLKQERLTRDIPVVILTGALGADAKDAAQAVGAIDYFTKPFSPMQLLSKVESILGVPAVEELEEKAAAKAEDAKLPPAAEPASALPPPEIAGQFNLSNLLSEIAREYQGRANAKNLEFYSEILPDLPQLAGNPGSVKEVFTQLLDNSLKFTQPHGRIRLSAWEEKDQVKIKIADSGLGMSREEHERIFSPAYLDKGLGLAIALRLIRALGGDMESKSTPREENSFIITLPRRLKQIQPLTQTAPANSRQLGEMKDQLLIYAQELSQLYQEEQNTTLRLKESIALMEKTYFQVLASLVKAIEARDEYTGGHTSRVTCYALCIARLLNHELYESRKLRFGVMLHDIGKIGIPDSILRKSGSLTDEEWEWIRQHPVIGEAILAPIDFLVPCSRIVRCHHERWDGKGYPDGLKGEEIPLESRIIAIADTIDAITSSRPYRERRNFQEAREIIQAEAGKQFDPEITKLLPDSIEHFLRSSDQELNL